MGNLRRWKTFCIKQKRNKELSRSWGYHGSKFNLHPKYLEHPTCDCSMCNKKNAWNEKSKKRKMRNGERKDICEFYNE